MAVAAMWRVCVIADDTRAAEAFEHASGRVRADQALLGYGLAHLVMIDGVIAVAAGATLSIHQLTSAVPSWDAWLIAGGAALVMAGSALFRRVMGFASPWAPTRRRGAVRRPHGSATTPCMVVLRHG
jgi:low temperature requirement protein LtrA